MKVFFDEGCLVHDPPYEFQSGRPKPYYEAPQRLLQIRQALEENPIFQIEGADRSIDAKKHALQVHSEDYLDYLETAFQLWVEAGGDPKVRAGLGVGPIVNSAHLSQQPFFPETFSNPKLVHHLSTARPPGSIMGKAGELPPFADGFTHVDSTWSRLLLL